VFRNPLPPVELLDANDLNRLIDAAFRVLQESGLEFLSARCLDILEKNGCMVDRETGVARMDRATVEHFVALAPETFTVHGRNPDRNTVLGGNYINFNTVGSPPNINDLDNGRRPGTYQALVDLIKLNQLQVAVGILANAEKSHRDNCAERQQNDDYDQQLHERESPPRWG